MIRALLVIWSLDPSGAGTVTGIEFPSLAECYAFAGRAQLVEKYRCATERDIPDVANLIRVNRCDGPKGAVTLVCRGRE